MKKDDDNLIESIFGILLLFLFSFFAEEILKNLFAVVIKAVLYVILFIMVFLVIYFAYS